MVFLIQSPQNRDAEAIQINLDELIRVTEAASNTLLDLEELDERSLDAFRDRYELLAEQARTNERAMRNLQGPIMAPGPPQAACTAARCSPLMPVPGSESHCWNSAQSLRLKTRTLYRSCRPTVGCRTSWASGTGASTHGSAAPGPS